MHEQEQRMQARFDSERHSIAAEFETLRDARTLASTHNWLAMLATGKYICLVCTSHFHLVKTRGNWRATMPFLECNGGYEPRDGQYTRSVARHEACDVHIQCVQLEGERQSNPLQHAIAVQQAAADEITARIFRTAIHLFLRYRPFIDHEYLVLLQNDNGASMGDRLHSHMTASRMLETVYPVLHQDVISFISTRNEYSGALRNV
mmetsp:Transcript_39478/g.97477  ORF Transcript_39478/g.97477 Transcript_39478/m.97477 type:complete len:205 (-) Transcript_39478:97-711(-)